jgi:hypothetical protein
VREDTQVKLSGFFGVVIEPEEWRKFVHGCHGTSRAVASGKTTYEDRSVSLMYGVDRRHRCKLQRL